ncbi:MAG: PspC domain-containing protein [Breznakibacter sp.]
MKKTISINISGEAFTIEEDAYIKLNQYLNDIRHRIQHHAEADEILADIEYRIAELIRAKCPTANEIATDELIEELMAVIGRPSDFGDSEDDQPHEKKDPRTSAQQGGFQSVAKKLYRDPTNRVLGGVCSGLAAYFNVDAVVMRILFVLLMFTSIGIFLYIGLWIAMPPAVTLQQRNEMMGFSNPSNQRHEPSAPYNTNRAYRSSADGFSPVFHALGRLIAIVVGMFMTIVGITLLSVFAIVLFWGQLFPNTIVEPFHNLIELPSAIFPSINLFLAKLSIGLLVGIPLIMLVFGGIQLIFNLRNKVKWIGISALVIWILALLLGFYITIKVATSVGDHTYSRQQHALKMGTYKKIYVETLISDSDWAGTENKSKNFHLKIDDWELTSQIKPSLRIVKGDSCRLIIEQESILPLKANHHEILLDTKDLWNQNDSVIYLKSFIKFNDEIRLVKVKYILEILDGYSLEVNPLLKSLIKEE